LPSSREGKLIYPETPEYFSQKAAELMDLGVQIIGGCCGTTPDHIRAVRRMVDARR
jgi:methionine synthase I (cobalamin-dependent)